MEQVKEVGRGNSSTLESELKIELESELKIKLESELKSELETET